MKRSLLPRGFSLVELLVVMAILIVLMALTLPAINSTMQANNLTHATQAVLDELSLARQSATSKNRVVETRFYRFADPASGSPDQRFRALQNFELQEDGSAVAIDRMRRLPQGVIIDGGATLSPLLGSARAKQWTTNDTQIPLPGIGTAYETRIFPLRPDGSTDLLASAQPWFATLHYENTGDNLSSPPPNFAMIQIDPWTGQAQLYRP